MKEKLLRKYRFHLRLPHFLRPLAVAATGVLACHAQEYTSARLGLRTQREILQTSSSSASFVNGSSYIVLADGALGASAIDSDEDGWQDETEDSYQEAVGEPAPSGLDYKFDPEAYPPAATFPPDVSWVIDPITGDRAPYLSESIISAQLVRPYSHPYTIISAKPAGSKLPLPISLEDHSLYIPVINPGSSIYELKALSLYDWSKSYGQADGAKMETDIVPGSYQVQFRTIANPYVSAGAWVNHYLVPNGSLTLGLKRPSWLLRSAFTLERLDQAPVEQAWVNGRLRFDPALPTTFSWDDIVQAGLASAQNDQITLKIEDEDGVQVWPPTEGGVVVSTGVPQVTLQMGYLYGIPGADDVPLSPLSKNGFMVMNYVRNRAGSPTSGDSSSVKLRVPIEMAQSFASWKQLFFNGSDLLNDSISGPNADPDGDGLTNQQEFDQGSNPSVPTIAVTNPISTDITSDSAVLGGTVVADPDSDIIVTVYEQGVVYSASTTNPFPMIDWPGVSRVVASPPGVGEYTVSVSGLTDGTQYSFRAYAITDLGTFYSSPISTFTTEVLPPVTLPMVASPTSSGIMATSVTLGGNVTSDGGTPITERGVVYSVTSTNDNPFFGGTGVTRITASGTTGSFTVSATGLSPATTYSFRAYAINAFGTSHTSEIGTFTTAGPPIVTSPTSTAITSSSATLGGNVTSSGGLAILQRGVVFSLTANPVMGGTGVAAYAAPTTGTGVFTLSSTGLLPARKYYFKAYAISMAGVSYSPEGNFTTLAALATITSPTISNLTPTSATLGANVTSDGSGAITERGFIYSQTAINSNPLVGGSGVTKVSMSGTTGLFSSNITGLTENAGYTFKPYAINSAGTAYGAPYAFFTTLPPLTVTGPTVADITASTAALGGTVESDGGTTATERGVVYSLSSTNSDPVVGGLGVMKTSTTGTMGTFTVEVAGLTPGADYSFKAYATNGTGTSYSDVSSFTTSPLILLGQSQVQWVSVEAPVLQIQSEPEEGSAQVQAEVQSQTVLQFVYLKDASEAFDPLIYQIETSSDFKEWQPIDENDWLIETTSADHTATWNSASNPPPSVFFRIHASIQ